MTITVDKKAGYMLLESRQDGFTIKWEMCYWNMADKKHKLLAYCVELSENGREKWQKTLKWDGNRFSY